MNSAHSRPASPVLFDLDGTIIDSVNLIRESHRYAVRTVLGVEFPDEKLIANVGRPLMEQMETFSPEHARELFHTYREWNHAHTADLLRPYAGIDRLLAGLVDAGHPLGIVTSKSRDAVELAWRVLPAVHARFDAVVTADDTDRHKPHPDPIWHALEALGGGDGGAYIGDAPFDIQAGKAAGLRTIGVTWGFFSRTELEGEQPDLVVDTPDALLAACLRG